MRTINDSRPEDRRREGEKGSESTVFDMPHAMRFTDARKAFLMHRRRTIVIAARQPVETNALRPAPEPRSASPWEKPVRMRLWRALRRLTR